VKIPKNVEWVAKNELCVSCGACKIACQHKAIKMAYSNRCGLILPVIEGKKCNGCEKCLEVCYGYKFDDTLYYKIFNSMPNSIIGNFINAYIGFATDYELRFNSTSGGIVTALLIYALKEKLIDGAIVTIIEEGDLRAKSFIATTIEEIRSASGAKYCPVPLAESLEMLESSKRYAVVGLPCQIYGIRKLAEFNSKIRKAILLYLGILCGGMPNYLGTQYLFRKYNVENQHVKRLEYRGGGWPGRLLIQYESRDRQGEIYAPYPEYWQGTFGYFQPFRCTVCYDGFNDFSDISCGDAWLPEIVEKDKIGTSLIITRTEIGEKLVYDAFQKGIIKISPIKVQDALRSQRGLVQYKYVTIKSRIKLARIIRKNLPIFNLNRTLPFKFTDFLKATELYVGRLFASRKNMWWLLDTYLSLVRSLGQVRIKFEKLRTPNR
jgi:coenzyme F420 hydrogenase subunit beta